MTERSPGVVRFIALSNLVSYLSLVFALYSIYFASISNLHGMAACWLLSGIADCFDGMFARKFDRTTMEKQFGKEIDTLIDLLAFGIAPVIGLFLLVSQQDTSHILFLYLAGGWYIFAAVHRLAYFNITVNEQARVFYGLPTTEAVLLLAFLLILPGTIVWSAPVLVLLGIGMLLPVQIKEPKTGWFIILMLCYFGLLLGHFWLGCQFL